MATCKPEIWTVEDLANAIEGKDRNSRKIVVPMFQRDRVWDKGQEKLLVDSILKGYPFGSMLFHERKENDETIYVLADGLQRSNTLKKYISDPLSFIENTDFSENDCFKIIEAMQIEKNEENIEKTRTELINFIKCCKKFDELKYTSIQNNLLTTFNLQFSQKLYLDLEEALDSIFKEKKNTYNTVKNTQIPVIIYSGKESTLTEIFKRINSKGTALTPYEIYAATWDFKKFKIDNIDIVNINVQKYQKLIKDDFFVDKFDINELINSAELNSFDYLYGLSIYLVNNFENLKKFKVDKGVNSFGFELVNACLNNSDKISELDKTLLSMKDVNEFEKALINSIKFVDEAIKPITQFKGNKRQSKKTFHGKFQIMAMIASTFKKMYTTNDYSTFDSNWKKIKDDYSKKLLNWYINDILTNFWSEGGTKKIYQVSNGQRYFQEISKETWESDLNGFFNKSLQRIEKNAKKVAPAKAEEFVILNTVYLKKFTTMDNLGLNKFDIEHISPKEQLAKLINVTKGSGLPISCIANLCYLPEYANRTKHENTFYQDDKYKTKVNIQEIEDKYSFTKEQDLKWLNEEYKNSDDFEKLKTNYMNYCRNRFSKIKQEFLSALDVK